MVSLGIVHVVHCHRRSALDAICNYNQFGVPLLRRLSNMGRMDVDFDNGGSSFPSFSVTVSHGQTRKFLFHIIIVKSHASESFLSRATAKFAAWPRACFSSLNSKSYNAIIN